MVACRFYEHAVFIELGFGPADEDRQRNYGKNVEDWNGEGLNYCNDAVYRLLRAYGRTCEGGGERNADYCKVTAVAALQNYAPAAVVFGRKDTYYKTYAENYEYRNHRIDNESPIYRRQIFDIVNIDEQHARQADVEHELVADFEKLARKELDAL